MLDTVIRNGSVIDGTGSPRRIADVGLRDGRIVAVGQVDEPARDSIDAEGLVVAPGFIDVHTHLDAQLMWDPEGSPSTLHGSTTVIGGNCGFTIAPMEHAAVDYIANMLSVVEGIPLESLQAGLDWKWRSFGEWLARLDGCVAPNAAFMVGHSTLRVLAMGERSIDGTASDDDIATMAAILDESLTQGGLGLSTSWTPAHIDHHGHPVPSRAASRKELLALAAVTGRHPGTMLQLAPGRPGAPLSPEALDTMIEMARLAQRPLNWNTIRLRTPDTEMSELMLGYCRQAAERGAEVSVLAYPDQNVSQISLLTGVIFDGLPGWADTMHAPLGERIRLLSNRQVRDSLKAGAAQSDTQLLKHLSNWNELLIMETFTDENVGLAGRTVGEVAASRNADAFDTFLDIAIADGLRTYVRMPPDDDSDEIWSARLAAWRDPRSILGDTDAGAHLDMMCGARCMTALLGETVRDRQLLVLEEAVNMITDRPARFYGLRGRGRIDEGWCGDVVLFDPASIGPGTIGTRHDLPGGAMRLYAEPTGIERVMVNGRTVVDAGEFTGERAGTVLRAFRDMEPRSVAST